MSLTAQNVKTNPSTCFGQVYYAATKKWVEVSVTNEAYVPQFSAWSTASVQAQAASQGDSAFFSNLRGAQRAISGPTFAGELRQTLRMLKRPASALRDFTLSWLDSTRKRTRGLKGKSLKKALASSYLEYQFGVKPLLNDTRAMADAAARLITGYRQTRVNGFGSAISDRSAVGASSRGYFQFRKDYLERVSARCTVKGGVRATAESPGILGGVERLRQVLGFNLSEFVPTAWELLPFSFVVDYFANVGDILEAYTTDTSQLIWYSRTMRLEQSYRCQVYTLGRNDSTYRIEPNQGCGSWETSQVIISRGSTLTYPVLSFRIPGVGQVANLSALWLALKKR